MCGKQRNVPRSYLAIPVESQVKLAKKACNRSILDTDKMTGRSGDEAGSVIRMWCLVVIGKEISVEGNFGLAFVSALLARVGDESLDVQIQG